MDDLANNNSNNDKDLIYKQRVTIELLKIKINRYKAYNKHNNIHKIKYFFKRFFKKKQNNKRLSVINNICYFSNYDCYLKSNNIEDDYSDSIIRSNCNNNEHTGLSVEYIIDYYLNTKDQAIIDKTNNILINYYNISKSLNNNIDDLLFKCPDINNYTLNDITFSTTILLTDELSLFIFKMLIIIRLLSIKDYTIIGEIPAIINKLLQHSFSNMYINSKFNKFYEIIFGTNDITDYNYLKQLIINQKNPNNLLKISFNLLLFYFETKIIPLQTETIFNRKSLYQINNINTFMGTCSYIYKMSLDSITFEYFHNISDIIKSFHILYTLKSKILEQYSINFIKKLQELFLNIKFKNTVQEIIVIIICNYLK